MKTFRLLILFILLMVGKSFTQTINFDWEAGLWLPGIGTSTTVVDDSVLVHLGGNAPYGVLYDNKYANSFVEIKYPNKAWQLTNIKLIQRPYSSAHYYNGKIYIVSGYSYPTSSKDVEILDPFTGQVTLGSPSPQGTEQAASVLYNGKIYLFGGIEKDAANSTGNYLNSLFIYDIAANSWTQGADFPVASSVYSAVVYKDKIYSFGHYNGTTGKEIYEYDIINNTWAYVGDTPEPISTNSNVVSGDNAFIIGDYINESRFWQYNFINKTWKVLESNFIGRRHASAVVMNNRLYVLGGVAQFNGDYRYLNIVQSMDLSQIVTSSGREENSQLVGFELEQNYPNPFNPSTVIRFNIPHEGNVNLKIFNSLGEQVAELLDEPFQAGKYEYEIDGSKFSSGVYFYQLRFADGWQQTKKMMLVK